MSNEKQKRKKHDDNPLPASSPAGQPVKALRSNRPALPATVETLTVSLDVAASTSSPTHKRESSLTEIAKTVSNLRPASALSSPPPHHNLLPSHPLYSALLIAFSLSFLLACCISFLVCFSHRESYEQLIVNPQYDVIDFPNPLETKYSLYLYRGENSESNANINHTLAGQPVIFIPGNAGSFRQVRHMAAETALLTNESTQDMTQLDFFTTDFGEDLTALHGRTILDQAQYINAAIMHVLSLYTNAQDKPTSVILIGHSMGGVVARTAISLESYKPRTVQTILTFAAPHLLPPATMDWDVVQIYERVNRYWQEAYGKAEIGQNPLQDMVVVSIVGGSLDRMIPAEHSLISSVVPETNGFTVFSSSIPGVWMNVDHEALIWYRELLKVLANSLVEVAQSEKLGSSTPDSRLQILKSNFLGKDPTQEQFQADCAATLPDEGVVEKLSKNQFGACFGQRSNKNCVKLLPLPAIGDFWTFSLLTDGHLIDGEDDPNMDGILVMACRPGAVKSLDIWRLDLAKSDLPSIRNLARNDAAGTPHLCYNLSKFKKSMPNDLSHIQIPAAALSQHFDKIVIVDNHSVPTSGILMANTFQKHKHNVIVPHGFWRQLFGINLSIPAGNMADISFTQIWSSLLAYKLTLSKEPMMVRYYTQSAQESTYVTKLQSQIIVHGVAPFTPFTLADDGKSYHNLHIDCWDEATIKLSLRIDVMSSLGRLFFHYRIGLIIFPMSVVAMVLYIQLEKYAYSGVFISFGESLRVFTRNKLPVVLVLTWCLPYILMLPWTTSLLYMIEPSMDVRNSELPTIAAGGKCNNFFLGLENMHLQFMGVIFVCFAVGLCHLVYYVVIGCIKLLSLSSWCTDPMNSYLLSIGLRVILWTTFAVMAIQKLPYQFGVIVGFLCQLCTAVRLESANNYNQNLKNWTVTLLIIIVWLLPLNVPMLVVWLHNYLLKWRIETHHSHLISIMPIMFLIERCCAGQMIPHSFRYSSLMFTRLMLAYLVGYTLIFGIQRSYWLHHLFNFFSAWLCIAYI